MAGNVYSSTPQFYFLCINQAIAGSIPALSCFFFASSTSLVDPMPRRERWRESEIKKDLRKRENGQVRWQEFNFEPCRNANARTFTLGGAYTSMKGGIMGLPWGRCQLEDTQSILGVKMNTSEDGTSR